MSRQSEVKRRALILGAFCPDPAAVTTNNALNSSQSDPRPFIVIIGMKASEGSEELSHMGDIEAGAIVTHIVVRDATNIFTTEFDPRLKFLLGELPSVP